MRRIFAAFARFVLVTILVAIGVAFQRDGAHAAGGVVLFAFTSTDPTPDPTFGSAVATGDVNADGRTDVIVGDPGKVQAHVYSGVDGAAAFTLSIPNLAPDVGFGRALATGDVNGDGAADIVVGAPYEIVGANTARGRVYVFSGVDGNLIRTLDAPDPALSVRFGSAAATGDVNSDGRADIVVAAPPPDGMVQQPSRGAVYVFSGTDGSLIQTVTTPYTSQLGQFGTAVAAGDVDGDGTVDLAVGAWGGFYYPMPYGAPYVSLFSGADGSLLRTLGPPVYARFDTQFGSALATGDVNGDGVADVIVGDPAVGTFVAGPAAYVFDGASGSLIYALTNPYPTPGEFPYFGSAVAAGDVDGDGRADAIVGMLPDPMSVPNVGRVFVFSGADGSVLDALDEPSPNIQWGNSVGKTVAAGDVTGDGKAEVVLGAPTVATQGSAYVFAHESDSDGCADAKELLLIPPTDPSNPWDFFSVPVPALFTAQYPATDFRDGVVAAKDAQAVFAYFAAGAKAGTVLYEQDLNRNGVRDGLEYDRSVLGPGRSGPPDGGITAQDAQMAFAQVAMGYVC